LLIDLENMTGTKARPALLGAKLDALIRRAGPGLPVVAACAGSRITPAGEQVLQGRKIRLIKTNESKNAADDALLAEAQRLSAAGCSRFVIASSDSRFAALAELGTLEIMAWAGQKSAQKYTARAAAVHRVDRPAASAAAASPAPPKGQPSTAAPSASNALPKGPASSRTAAPASAAASQSPRPMTVVNIPASPAAAAACLAAGGFLFGAAAVLGAATAIRLLGLNRGCHHRSLGRAAESGTLTAPALFPAAEWLPNTIRLRSGRPAGLRSEIAGCLHLTQGRNGDHGQTAAGRVRGHRGA
jgi:hypothetical protein